jgi:hypothetical protein
MACAFKSLAQILADVERAAQRASEFLCYLAARIGALCASKTPV